MADKKKKQAKKETTAEKFGMWVFYGLLIIVGILFVAVVVANLISGNDYFDVEGAINSQWFTFVLVAEAFGVLYLVLTGFFKKKDKKEKKVEQFYSNRWMKPDEINKIYKICGKLSALDEVKKSGWLTRFEREGNDVNVNMEPKDNHCIVLGTSGSGKGAGFVIPTIWSMGHTGQKPSMIITDPKGELFDWTSEALKKQGYEVLTLNLKDPTKSARWNPLENVWNMFQRANNLEKELKVHYGENPADLNLKHIAAKYPHEWYSFDGVAYPEKPLVDQQMMALKQKLLSDAESELADICAVIATIENEREPSWEKGARDLIQATLIAMLEDSLVPELGMTKDKFNFYNVNKILSIRDDDGQNMYGTIKDYFKGRDAFSASISLSNTVLTNAEITMRSFFGTVTGKMSLFNDKGVCYVTSGTDLDFSKIADKPTALYLIIPDQIKVRWKLATMCVAQLYKKLVEISEKRGGGPLKTPVYFILDEFGNMPKFENFATMITVSRGRGVFFSLIMQDYKQLETIYGQSDAVTVRNNCNTQIMIAVNDSESRKIFSDLCGEMAIDVETKSENKAKKEGGGDSKGTSTSKVSRPLLPPNELLDIKPGQVFIYSMDKNPLRSTFSNFYMLTNKTRDPKSNPFITITDPVEVFSPMKFLPEDKIYYDIKIRNSTILKDKKKNDIFDW